LHFRNNVPQSVLAIEKGCTTAVKRSIFPLSQNIWYSAVYVTCDQQHFTDSSDI